MSFQKEIPELLKEGVIDKSTADRIAEYYQNKGDTSTNRLFVVFGVLGAILVGMGIILILAHNWDELSRLTKTVLAFVPLLIGQILCGFTLYNKSDSTAWRETAAAFLFFAVGASIALVSQIYHMPGELDSFLFTWAVISIPLFYVMRSSVVSLLYLIGITWYACEACYFYPRSESYHYWWLIALGLPYYFIVTKQKPDSNFINFHNWLLPLSVTIVLGTLSDEAEILMWVAYASLFGLFYLIGHSKYFASHRLLKNGFKVIGAFGTVFILLNTSFDYVWNDQFRSEIGFSALFTSAEGIGVLLTTLSAFVALFVNYKNKSSEVLKPFTLVFIFFIIIFMLGFFTAASQILINILTLGVAILTIIEGGEQNHLGVLNFGLLIIAALITCRFFDTDMSFVFRGIIFVLVGLGFFAVNYWMLQKRKEHEQ